MDYQFKNKLIISKADLHDTGSKCKNMKTFTYQLKVNCGSMTQVNVVRPL